MTMIQVRAMLAALVATATITAQARPVQIVEPLVIGETFTIASAALDEVRRINVYRATGYGAPADAPLPMMVMPDGGIGEDFIHVAGLVQVSVGNGTMRPFMLVGIENTERRRDLTGPTSNQEDRKIAPRVGGSAAFRDFLRDELMPEIRRRYPTTGETALVGESLAGLFVVETFLLEPQLFDSYLAFDPSLWWDNQSLLIRVEERLVAKPGLDNALFLANSDQPEIAETTSRLARALTAASIPGLRLHYLPMPDEQHRTIYHPAALRAFRVLFAPEAIAGE